MTFTWTEEHIKTLKTLWQKGVAARDIAAKLGKSVTRNSVIGKANRLGISGQQRSNATSTYIQLPVPTDFQCQWAFGHVEEKEFYFCLKPTIKDKPYCSEHCDLAFRRQGDAND